MSQFEKHTIDEHTISLSQYMPNGDCFFAKLIDDMSLNLLNKSLSYESKNINDLIIELVNQYDINVTIDLIQEWERAVGIPDGCFNDVDNLSIEERRRQVLAKIFMRQTHTKDDYITLANILVPGIKIRIDYEQEPVFFPLTFPLEFSTNTINGRYRVIVHLDILLNPDVFPLPFPLPFSNKKGNIIECIFNKIKPIYTTITYIYDL